MIKGQIECGVFSGNKSLKEALVGFVNQAAPANYQTFESEGREIISAITDGSGYGQKIYSQLIDVVVGEILEIRVNFNKRSGGFPLFSLEPETGVWEGGGGFELVNGSNYFEHKVLITEKVFLLLFAWTEAVDFSCIMSVQK
jgi:hypothetical protein